MSPVLDSLAAATPQQRQTAAIQYQYANQWLTLRRPDKAIRLLLNCCRLDPANLIYRKGLRTAQRQQRLPGGLVGWLKRWRAARRLRTALKGNDPGLSLQAAEQLLVVDPRNLDAHLALARTFEAVGHLDNAVWCLEQALSGTGEANDRPEPIRVPLARLYERTGKFSLAIALAERPAKRDPESTAAVQGLQKQIDGAPAKVDLYVQLARTLQSAGDVLAARACLARGLAATGNAFELGMEQARLEIQLLREDKRLLEQKLGERQGDRELSTMLDRLNHEIQAREIDLCRQHADRHPSDHNARLDFGILLLKAGQFDAALEAFLAIRGDPQLAWRALVYAGYCHLNARRWRRAEPLFQEALPLIPADAEATRKEVLLLLASHAP